MRWALAFLLASAASGAAAGAPPASEISPAERLVFLDDHLSGVRPPTHLRYSFAETGPTAAGRDDELRLALGPRADGGCCAVTAEEQGGAAFTALPPVEDARANPVVLYFLERDVRRMQSLTGGQSNYFRRLIRLSLADHAAVSDTTIRYGSRQLPAREIRIAPYAQDPRRPLYEALADKAYVFVLAEGVPGRVYQIRTETPSPTPGAPPVADAVLTLAEPLVQERSR